VCCERPTPTADYQPSFHSPWLAADEADFIEGRRTPGGGAFGLDLFHAMGHSVDFDDYAPF
ncbi:MAG: hypothetical protein FE835_06770, partial [Gammaproteobacteria bacterium]|nr:hypothetical protein [Gammaproteobacteria bacterium]